MRHFHSVDLYVNLYVRQNEAIHTIQIPIFEAIPTHINPHFNPYTLLLLRWLRRVGSVVSDRDRARLRRLVFASRTGDNSTRDLSTADNSTGDICTSDNSTGDICTGDICTGDGDPILSLGGELASSL